MLHPNQISSYKQSCRRFFILLFDAVQQNKCRCSHVSQDQTEAPFAQSQPTAFRLMYVSTIPIVRPSPNPERLVFLPCARPRSLRYQQSRQPRHPKGNSNALWSHDLFENLNEGSPQPKQLSTRLTSSATGPMLVSNFLVTRALREAAASSDPSQSSGPLSIKGASGSSGNVVQVEGLVNGTTPADVEVCSHSYFFFSPRF